jgi:hypothetical protein
MMRSCAIYLVVAAATVQSLSAQRSAQGSLRVNAQIEGSLSIVFTDSQGARAAGSGSNAAFLTIPVYNGSFSTQSGAPLASDTDFIISTPFSVRVTKANLMSANYSLKARLSASDRAHSWRIDGLDISSGDEYTIATSEPYGIENPHTMVVSGRVLPGQLLFNALNVQVTAN